MVGDLERGLTPALKQLLSSGGVAQLASAVSRAEGSARRSINTVTAGVWHLMNLPTATDVQRVRVLVAELDQQLRQLQRTVDRGEDGPHP